ncbi:thiamine diphosphokinase [Mesoplasma whartonense]|uniref:thiamine diphosphokinase n=1 Tax=Mesoplasma whartonense TaxID=2878854 RepID=UPI002022AA9C|nr:MULTISPECIES: thiamine diphosphokinase [unclassified Mesoplasma]MCL8213001.1 hypothetical protein [Mesoplasma sp. JKS002661]MCL8216262.1 hypothetical protein [Mesoplasma sp. JKS002657]
MENKKVVLIVTTTTQLNFDRYNNEHFFIIGVERGCLDLIEKRIKLDLAISDFDQVLPEELVLIKDYALQFTKLSFDKDWLDGLVALKTARELFPQAPIKFVSKPTKRYDMNLSILDIMNQYDDVEIFNEHSLIKKIPAGTREINFNNFQEMTYLSFFSLKNNNHLILENLAYPYQGILDVFSTRCISNAFIAYQNPKISNSEPLVVIMSK